MTRPCSLDVALASEIGDVLVRHGNVACRPSLDSSADGEETILTVVLPNTGLAGVELTFELQRAIDVATIRGLAARYQIKSEDIERAIFKKEEKL